MATAGAIAKKVAVAMERIEVAVQQLNPDAETLVIPKRVRHPEMLLATQLEALAEYLESSIVVFDAVIEEEPAPEIPIDLPDDPVTVTDEEPAAKRGRKATGNG